jgi:hypothetical protein
VCNFEGEEVLHNLQILISVSKTPYAQGIETQLNLTTAHELEIEA